MGSYSPVAGIDGRRADEIARLAHQPVIDELRRRGTPYHGVLYAGLMMTASGPRVLEYNCRFGDPETQAVLPRLRSDLLELLEAYRPSGLAEQVEWSPDWAVTLVLASRGYPGSASKGDPISGLDAANATGAEVLHAGTAEVDGAIVTAGGRVLNVTATGATAAQARARAAAAERIEFEGKQIRTDIAAGVDQPRSPAPPIAPERIATGPREGADGRGGWERGSTGTEELSPVTETAVEHQFDDLDVDAPRVGIVMGSKSDMPLMEKAGQELDERGIRHELRVMSAHRDPDTVAEYAKNASSGVCA